MKTEKVINFNGFLWKQTKTNDAMSHRLRCAHRDRSKCLADVFCCGAFLISHEPENKNLSRPTTTIDAIKWNYTQRSIHIPSGLQQRSPRSHEHWSRIFHTKKKCHSFIFLFHWRMRRRTKRADKDPLLCANKAKQKNDFPVKWCLVTPKVTVKCCQNVAGTKPSCSQYSITNVETPNSH